MQIHIHSFIKWIIMSKIGTTRILKPITTYEHSYLFVQYVEDTQGLDQQHHKSFVQQQQP